MDIHVRLLGSLGRAMGVLGTAMLVACSHANSAGVIPNVGGPALRAGSAGVASSGPSTSDGVYTDAQAKRGEAVYRDKCTKCHFDDLLGDDCAPALAGPYFSMRWNGLTVGTMYELMNQSMPIGAPRLSPQEYVDIIGYVLSVNRLPAGSSELSTERQKLDAMKFRLPL